MNSRLMFRAALATLLLPGTVTLLVPYLLLRQSGVTEWPRVSALGVLAIVAGAAGFALLLHSIWAFAYHGRGTLAPLDPTRELVVKGMYRYTRNPMYTGVVVVLLSEALLFGSRGLLLYAVMAFLWFHLFVLFYEEPRLRAQFGDSFSEYVKKVPRWGITIRLLNP
jgi:protein-S-isoprenylcysteine O-methyltransferase Ste14